VVLIRCQGIVFQDIQAVFWDKDGTLANSEGFLWKLAERRSHQIDRQIPGTQTALLRAFGVDRQHLDPTSLMAVGSRRENEVAAAAYIAEQGYGWIESLEIAQQAFKAADQDLPKAPHTPLVPGALDLLQVLAQSNVKQGILSSDSTAHVEEFTQTYSLGAYFQLQWGSDRHPNRPPKPHPDFLRDACDALQVFPQRTLLIGDSAADVQMARGGAIAGFIGIRAGWSRPFILDADVVCDRFQQIQVDRMG
jgi:phosphoglycolate phosphatase